MEKRLNPSIRTYIKKIQNKIIFKIKTGYYLKRFTTETIKFLGSTKGKTTENKNGKNVLNLEITISTFRNYY